MTNYLDRPVDLSGPGASAVDELAVWASRFGALLLDNLPLERGVRVLDVGCATGFPLVELAQRHGASCRLAGVDVWADALARAAFKLRAYGVENASLACADGARLPFAAEAFDLVVSNLGINNFEDPAGVMAECFRVARPGARLALTTNLVGHFRELYDAFRDLLEERGDPAALERLAANEAHRGTADSVRALAEGAGFRTSRAVEGEFAMRFADARALFDHALTRIGFLDGWRRVAGPEAEREVFAGLERRLDERAAGELRMTVPMLYYEAVKPR